MLRRLLLIAVLVSFAAAGGLFTEALAPSVCDADGKKVTPGAPAPKSDGICHAEDIKVPDGILKKDGSHKLHVVNIPGKGALEFHGLVKGGELTDGWPVFQGKRLEPLKGEPSAEFMACAKSKGLAAGPQTWFRFAMDWLVPDAEARWCAHPMSLTRCSGGYTCTTCVFSGRRTCGCYSF